MPPRKTPADRPAKKRQPVSIDFSAYCNLLDAKARLSRETGCVLSLSETIDLLIERAGKLRQ